MANPIFDFISAPQNIGFHYHVVIESHLFQDLYKNFPNLDLNIIKVIYIKLLFQKLWPALWHFNTLWGVNLLFGAIWQLKLHFKFWLPDCSLSALGRISWFSYQRVRPFWCHIKNGSHFYTDCKIILKMCAEPCSSVFQLFRSILQKHLIEQSFHMPLIFQGLNSDM